MLVGGNSELENGQLQAAGEAGIRRAIKLVRNFLTL